MPFSHYPDVGIAIAHPSTGEAMPLITQLGLKQKANYFGHAAPFHCFTGDYKGGPHKVSIVTNGKDPKFGCDNVRLATCCYIPFFSFVNDFTYTIRLARSLQRWQPTWQLR